MTLLSNLSITRINYVHKLNTKYVPLQCHSFLYKLVIVDAHSYIIPRKIHPLTIITTLYIHMQLGMTGTYSGH